MAVSAILLSLYAFHTPKTSSQLADIVRSWADLGFSFATSILGFLIAGFTISATLNRPDLYAMMARRQQPTSGLSYLKDNFLRLIRTFIAYMLFAALCLGIKLFAFPDGPFSLLFGALPINKAVDATIKLTAARIALIWVGAQFVFVLMSLHPFVFNVYHLVVTGIRFGVEIEALSEDKPDGQEAIQSRPT